MLHDLRPYICVNEVCALSNPVDFEDEQAWYEHQRSHVLEWVCDGDGGLHAPVSCSSEAEFDEHIKSHKHTLNAEDEVQIAHRYARKPSATVLNACPFCDFLPKDGAPSKSHEERANDKIQAYMESPSFQTTIRGHVLDHLQDFFLYALLPSMDALEAGSDKKSIGPTRGSITHLKEIALVHGEQDLGPHVSNVDLTIPDAKLEGHESLSNRFWRGYEKGEAVSHAQDDFLQAFIAAQKRTCRSEIASALLILYA